MKVLQTSIPISWKCNLQRRCARRCLHWRFCIHHSIMSRLRNPNCGVSPLSHYAWCWDTDRRKSDEINTKSDEVSKSRCEWMYPGLAPRVKTWGDGVWRIVNVFTRDYAGGESGGKKTDLFPVKAESTLQCCGVFWAFQWFLWLTSRTIEDLIESTLFPSLSICWRLPDPGSHTNC